MAPVDRACHAYGTEHGLTKARRLRTNGQAERINEPLEHFALETPALRRAKTACKHRAAENLRANPCTAVQLFKDKPL